MRPAETFQSAGRDALQTLLSTWYTGNGAWNECDRSGCAQTDTDWGADSLTYALWLGWSTSGDVTLAPAMDALATNAPSYPAPCNLPDCQSWSDVPAWDAIAAVREYQVTKDPAALAKAEAAFQFVDQANAYSLGSCPDIPYQQPGGGSNDLKTLESDANALKAAILLFQVTGRPSYLSSAEARYAAIRAHFLDPHVPLYTVYVFDNGTSCSQLPHRFFASVNGDMIWSGIELQRVTHRRSYLDEAVASAKAVASDLGDPAGVFADLQAENDVVEPLVEAMYVLATDGRDSFARTWILRNATAALSERTRDGSYGRFFDGPPPVTTVTAWETNGGLALEIAAAALDPNGGTTPRSWAGAERIAQQVGASGTITFDGSGIALIGTLGENCCEAGHARVFVDGRETFDETGIWQDKSSSGLSIPGTVLFAWCWPVPGRHTISFAPGLPNGKEGGSYLEIQSYLVRRGPSPHS